MAGRGSHQHPNGLYPPPEARDDNSNDDHQEVQEGGPDQDLIRAAEAAMKEEYERGSLVTGVPASSTDTPPAPRKRGRPRKSESATPATPRGWKFRMPKHDISALDTLLTDITGLRQRLFTLDQPLELTPAEFQVYWPYVDNVWVRQHRLGAGEHDTSMHPTSESGSPRGRTEYYCCRLHPPHSGPRDSEGGGGVDGEDGTPPAKRKRQMKGGGVCMARMKAVFSERGAIFAADRGTPAASNFPPAHGRVMLSRVHGGLPHSHDLAHSDRMKRNSVVMDVARAEVMNGFMPASTFARMGSDPAKLAAIGGEFLTRTDVRNASAAWRLQHKAPLLVHPGYRYDNGFGVVPDSEAPDQRSIDNSGDAASVAATAAAAVAAAASQPYTASPNYRPPSTTSVPSPQSSALVPFPLRFHHLLSPYLPPPTSAFAHGSGPSAPHVTLTYATSLDSHLSLLPSTPTALSSSIAKSMTHHLRMHHDALLIGVGTAIADDPTANCRLPEALAAGASSRQPRPIILDPTARWPVHANSACIRAAHEGHGKAPWVIVGPGANVDRHRVEVLNKVGGRYFALRTNDPGSDGASAVDTARWLSWEGVFAALFAEGIRSVMVEGGATVLGELLRPENHRFSASVVLTVVPTYLGSAGGAAVRPGRRVNEMGKVVPAVRFQDVKWVPLGDEDVVMCGRLVGGAQPHAESSAMGRGGWGGAPHQGTAAGTTNGHSARHAGPSPGSGHHPLQAILAYNNSHVQSASAVPSANDDSGRVFEQLRLAAAGGQPKGSP